MASTLTIIPSNSDYVHIFPQLTANRSMEASQTRGKGKSILSGRNFEPAEQVSQKNVMFSPSVGGGGGGANVSRRRK
jgi:hypothetical protein